MEFVFKWEGGLSRHPADPGGLTNLGVTQRVYDAWRKSKQLPLQSVEHLKKPEALEIYEENYWKVAGCHKLDFPLAACQMDCAVNMGPGRAKTLLEGCQGNWKTYIEMRNTYYLDLVKRRPTMKVFLKGWLNRTNDLRKYIDIELARED